MAGQTPEAPRRRVAGYSVILLLTVCNPLQYKPIGANCGDGATLNQTCYLVPNTGPGNFGSLQEISPQGLPRVLQFSARFSF